MPNSDPWDRFVHPYLTLMSDSYDEYLKIAPVVQVITAEVLRYRMTRNVSPLKMNSVPTVGNQNQKNIFDEYGTSVVPCWSLFTDGCGLSS